MTKILEAFNRWFSSRTGVYQTFIVTAGVVLWEQLNPTKDPHGFWLLYALTVYSGVTQNILAYCTNRTATRTDEILARLEHMLSDECVVDTKTYELVKELVSNAKSTD